MSTGTDIVVQLDTTVIEVVDETTVISVDLSDGTGPAGPPGPQGDPGPAGADGPEGPQGPAATIAVGTVTTGTPGSPVEVANSGTSGAAVFDFTIPQGDTGAQGPQGDPGQGAETAADVPIVDLDNLFTATDVEGALVETMNALIALLAIVANMATAKSMLFGDNAATEFDLVHSLGSEYLVVVLFDVDTGMVVIDNEGHATDSDTWHVGPLETVYGTDKLRAVLVAPPA